MKHLKTLEALNFDKSGEKFRGYYDHSKKGQAEAIERLNQLKEDVLGLCEYLDFHLEEIENAYRRNQFGLQFDRSTIIISHIPKEHQDTLFNFLTKHKEWLSERMGWNIIIWNVPGCKDMICLEPWEKLAES